MFWGVHEGISGYFWDVSGCFIVRFGLFLGSFGVFLGIFGGVSGCFGGRCARTGRRPRRAAAAVGSVPPAAPPAARAAPPAPLAPPRNPPCKYRPGDIGDIWGVMWSGTPPQIQPGNPQIPPKEPPQVTPGLPQIPQSCLLCLEICLGDVSLEHGLQGQEAQEPPQIPQTSPMLHFGDVVLDFRGGGLRTIPGSPNSPNPNGPLPKPPPALP